MRNQLVISTVLCATISLTACDRREEAAETRRDVSAARINGAHEIAIERCERLQGDVQSDCKESADQARDAARDQASERREHSTP